MRETTETTDRQENTKRRTFVLVEFGINVVESSNDEVVDEADLITQLFHLNGQLLSLLTTHTHTHTHTFMYDTHTGEYSTVVSIVVAKTRCR